MRLCALRIGIHFLKDPSFRALVDLRDPFDELWKDIQIHFNCNSQAQSLLHQLCS